MVKTKKMEQDNPWLLKVSWQSNSLTQILSLFTTGVQTSVLDQASAMKASVALANEIALPKLIERLLNVLAENVAAQRCVLLLSSNKQLFIEGEVTAQKGIINLLESINIEANSSLVPQSIIQYVNTTQENVVLDNAAETKQFAKDIYIAERQTKSVLCTPLLYQSKLIGILYFENDLTTNAFTPECLAFLNVLSSHIANSIANARLHTSFERFVPKQFLELLEKKSPDEFRLGDSIQKNLTILFTDIRGFTTLSDQNDAKTIFQLLNSFLSNMEPIIRKYNGFIDKFIGDAIMALFPNSPEDAINAAVDMQYAINLFNEKHNLNLRLGIGINTGECILGTVGSQQRMDGSVMGDVVNAASRIEELTKIYGSQILISNQTKNMLTSTLHSFRYIDKTLLRGKSKPEVIWEVLDGTPPNQKLVKLKNMLSYEQAVKAFLDRQFEQAKKLFAAYLVNCPEDVVAKLYFKRCDYYLTQGVPSDWDGTSTYAEISALSLAPVKITLT